jgi:hypothetical protein
MFTDAFDKVDLPNVHCTLHEKVLRLFQVRTCKQVMNSPARDSRRDIYPCCAIHMLRQWIMSFYVWR